jgi:hypothetical protein
VYVGYLKILIVLAEAPHRRPSGVEVDKHTLETYLVALQGGNGFSEQFFCVLVAAVDTGDIDLFPLNWYIIRSENLLDGLGDFGANTIARDKSDGVLPTKLGRLEDIALDCGHCCMLQSVSGR